MKRAVSNVSDGEQRHWPPRPTYRPSSDENYLIKLGQAWIDRDRIGELGVQYYIDKLPPGYATWETASGDGSQIYKRLFGHPSGKFYDSVPTYLPHFLWLQDDMRGDCTCKLCGGKGSVATAMPKPRKRNALDQSNIIPNRTVQSNIKPNRTMLPNRISREVRMQESDPSTRESSANGLATGRIRRDVKQSGVSYARDEEGTEDVYKLFIRRLEGAKDSIRGVDDDIKEPNSIDWRAEHEYGEYGSDHLPTHITHIEQQHCFIPRVGELVLWCPHFLDSHHLTLERATSSYKFYSFQDKRFHGHPEWRAGVVTEVPSANVQNGPVDFPDILDAPDKNTALNTAGFRVETLPDPNDPMNKADSKQYKYVPLRSIRPLSQWQFVLRGIPEKKLHKSIKSALTCMTSISLVEKFKAVGHWPAASIFCKGVFLGSELIVVGDTIRLISTESPKQCTDVMVVDSIRLNLEGMQQDHTLPQSKLLCSRSSVSFVGSTYTLDKSRSYDMPDQEMMDDGLEQVVVPTPLPREMVKVIFRPVGSAEYGAWYKLHADNKKYEVSYDQVLGRLYEADAVRLWTGQRQEKIRNGDVMAPPSLDFDVSGILSARYYATATDERLPKPEGRENLWYWADDRVQALDLATFNGHEVGRYYDVRDEDTLLAWHEIMKILNGHQTTVTVQDQFTSIFPTSTRGRKPGSRLVNGKVVYPGDPDYPGGTTTEENDMRPKASSQMAGAALQSTDEEESEEEDDDDIEIVGEASGTSDEMLSRFTSKPFPSKSFTSKPPPQPAKKVLTKAEIMDQPMHSIEGGHEFDDDVSEEDPWWDEPIPLARGGTEESEGGDYDPKKVSHRQPYATGKKTMYGYDSDEA